MQLHYTPEQDDLRQEIREFLRSSLPEATRLKCARGERLPKQEVVDWARILNRKGWSAPGWPKKFGGPGWGAVEQYIFEEEMQALPAPELSASGLRLVGPVIYTFGNAAQQARFLPRILNHDDWWAQGFSEPGAGSDLASLRTAARRVGSDYIVNGQKTWTTLAHYANWIFCLVRTETTASKQDGISFLLIDLSSPGVTVRPIITIEGGHEVNEVFFDDVRVPAENLVGEEGKGWSYAKFLLGNERTFGAHIGQSMYRLRRIKALANALGGGVDRRFREQLALAEAEMKALEMTAMRVVSAEQAGGDRADPASSILKLKGSDLRQATSELLLELAGPYAMLAHATQDGDAAGIGPAFAPMAADTYFNWRKVSIFGGSNEIQRNIIAKRLLDL